MKVRACIIPSCSNTIGPLSRLDVCSTCRSSFYYWGKRSPAQMINRREKLKLYDERLQNMLGNKRSKK